MAKRMGEGKSRLESLRCLKRHLADVVFRTMVADALGPPRLNSGALTT
jgi:hypothetical protein